MTALKHKGNLSNNVFARALPHALLLLRSFAKGVGFKLDHLHGGLHGLTLPA